jgi:uncharacterized membrane protein
MWLARPLYESLPYAYAAAGIAGIVASWVIRMPVVPMLLLAVGALSLLLGMVLGLRRWNYRRQQAEYNSRSLDELENA